MTENDQEKNWLTLTHGIRKKNCTPILGAGAAYPRLPLGSQLAGKLLQEEEEETKTIAPLTAADKKNLAKVAQYIAVQRKDNPHVKDRMAEHLQEQGKPIAGAASNQSLTDPEPHAVLAALELPVYLTTNYDDFMVQALKARGARPVQEFARWNPRLLEKYPSIFDDPNGNYEPSPKEPLVFHMHGVWDRSDTMVATEDDYLDFLVNISRDLGMTSKKAILPLKVRRALIDSSLLFIGYRLEDINFRVILRGLLGGLTPAERRMGISVQYCAGQPGALERYVEEYFDHTLGLSVFWYGAQEFCQKLNTRLAESQTAAAATAS